MGGGVKAPPFRMRVIEGPKDGLIEMLQAKNPHWTVDDWEIWWCKFGRDKWPKDLKVCDKCNCGRRNG